MHVSVSDAKAQRTDLIRRAEAGDDFARTDLKSVLADQATAAISDG